MIMRLSLDLPDDSEFIRTARLLSQCLLDDIKVTKDIVADVETIVGELCSNVVRHAHSTTHHYQVTMDYYQPKVVIIVKDTGEGFDMNGVKPVGTSRPDGIGGQRIGGYGLSLLEGLSDKLDFTMTQPHGTTVIVEKNLRFETEEDARKASLRDALHNGDPNVVGQAQSV